jgi:hypothetical protein
MLFDCSINDKISETARDWDWSKSNTSNSDNQEWVWNYNFLSQPELKHWNLKDEYVIFGQYLAVTSTIQLKGMQEWMKTDLPYAWLVFHFYRVYRIQKQCSIVVQEIKNEIYTAVTESYCTQCYLQ